MRKYITKGWTFLGYFLGSLWIWIVIAIAVSLVSQGRELWAVAVAYALFLAYITAVSILNPLRLKRRTADLQKFAQNYGLRVANEIEAMEQINSLGAIDQIRDTYEKRILNLLVGDEWQYCDFKYKNYVHTKYGDYNSSTVYYSVMSTKLPRILPNVFFDSIKARHRQFRFHFARSQRHSLEGDFDKFFVTYFPPGYTIDSMSFISPDVMWVMRDAADYDIEIVGDHLFLYGPLYDPEKQLPDMSAKIKKIKKELLDNILTYRDERLPFGAGRQTVTASGMSLRKSRFWQIVGILTFVAYVVARIALDHFVNN